MKSKIVQTQGATYLSVTIEDNGAWHRYLYFAVMMAALLLAGIPGARAAETAPGALVVNIGDDWLAGERVGDKLIFRSAQTGARYETVLRDGRYFPLKVEDKIYLFQLDQNGRPELVGSVKLSESESKEAGRGSYGGRFYSVWGHWTPEEPLTESKFAQYFWIIYTRLDTGVVGGVEY